MRMRDPLDGRGARGRTDGRWSDPILVVFLFSPPLSLALPTSFYICAPPPHPLVRRRRAGRGQYYTPPAHSIAFLPVPSTLAFESQQDSSHQLGQRKCVPSGSGKQGGPLRLPGRVASARSPSPPRAYSKGFRDLMSSWVH